MGHVEDYSIQQEKARPLGRSLSDFGTLKPAEQILLDCCRAGKAAKITATRPTEPNAKNVLRAGFVRFLLLGGDNQTPIHEHGIQLRGAYIEGVLDLKDTRVWYTLSITHCTFAHTLDFRGAKFNHSAELDSCVIPGLNGQRLTSEGVLSLIKVTSQSSVNLQYAKIGGQFNCSGASFDGKNGNALSFDGAMIKGDVILTDEFKALGEVRLLGAHIDGQFNCSGAILNGQDGNALSFDGALIKGNVILINNFKAIGKVRLAGAQITGQFNCSGASFDGKDSKDSKDSYALCFDCAMIKGDVFLDDKFKAIGEVRFLAADIDGSIFCSDANFYRNDGDALCFDGAIIKGSVILSNNFKAIGEVRFLGAQIGGQLNCSSATFDSKDGDALSFDGTVINGNVDLNDNFKAIGKVRLLAAQINGQLNCTGATFENDDGDALSFDGAIIKGSVILSTRFKARGRVSLTAVQIDGQLNCKDASFDGQGRAALCFDGAMIKNSVFLGNSFKALGQVSLTDAQILGSLFCIGASFNGPLNANRMRVDGALVLRKLKIPLRNASFSRAKVAVLRDDNKSWGSDLYLDGFVYDFIDTIAPVRAKFRLDWLDKQSSAAAGIDRNIGAESKFCPQPWRQLQHVLREMGHTEEALEVGLAFELRLRKAGLIGQPPESCPIMLRGPYSAPARGLHYAYGLLTGFGYKPIRLLVWFLATWLACSGIYWWAAAQEGVFAPSNPIVFQHADYVSCRPDRESVWRKQNPAIELPIPKEFSGPGNWYLCENLREEYTGFSPLAFSMDVLLPLVDLQQEKDWAPVIPTPKAGLIDELSAFGWKYFTRLVIWLQTLFGWVLSLLLVAIVSGLTRRRE